MNFQKLKDNYVSFPFLHENVHGIVIMKLYSKKQCLYFSSKKKEAKLRLE